MVHSFSMEQYTAWLSFLPKHRYIVLLFHNTDYGMQLPRSIVFSSKVAFASSQMWLSTIVTVFRPTKYMTMKSTLCMLRVLDTIGNCMRLALTLTPSLTPILGSLAIPVEAVAIKDSAKLCRHCRQSSKCGQCYTLYTSLDYAGSGGNSGRHALIATGSWLSSGGWCLGSLSVQPWLATITANACLDVCNVI